MQELKKDLKEHMDISIDEIPENLAEKIRNDVEYYKKLKLKLKRDNLTKEKKQELASIICAIDDVVCRLIYPSDEQPICPDCGIEERDCNCKEDY